MPKTSFHVQHNTSLSAVTATLVLCSTGQLNASDLADQIGFAESVVSKLVLPFLRQMGLLSSGGQATALGERLEGLRDDRPEMLGEAMHLRLYPLHWLQPAARFSFAYATLCDWLTDREEFRLDGDGQADLVGVVIRRAAEAYHLDPSAIAFSRSSVQGACNWLQATDPPALRDGLFRRRRAASALAVLWAVDALYRRERIPFGTRLSLTPDREADLAHLLLLDPDSLNSVLEATARTEGSRRVSGGRWLALGAEGGFGRWLLLNSPAPAGATLPGQPEDEAEVPERLEGETLGSGEPEAEEDDPAGDQGPCA